MFITQYELRTRECFKTNSNKIQVEGLGDRKEETRKQKILIKVNCTNNVYTINV